MTLLGRSWRILAPAGGLLLGLPALGGSPGADAREWLAFSLREQGETALQQARSIEIDSVEDNPGFHRIDARSLVANDGRFFISASMAGFGTLIRAYDGTVAWQSNGALGSGFLAPGERGSLISTATLLVGMGAGRQFESRRFLGFVDAGGVPSVQLELGHLQGPRQIWTLERKTGLVTRIEHVETRFGRDSTITYSDFRTVDGLDAPFLITVSVGAFSYRVQRTRILLNAPVDGALLAPPPGFVAEAGFLAALIHRHLVHEGDPEALGSITSKVIHERQDNPVAGTSDDITYSVAKGAPNRFLEVRTSAGMGTAAVGFDGREGWSSNQVEGNRALERDEIAAYLANDIVRGDSDMAERYPLRRYLGERSIEGRRTYAVLLSGQYQRAAVFYFDPETYRVVRIGAARLGSGGNSVEATIDFADFRRVKGIEFPFRITTSNAAFRMVTAVDSIDINTDIPAETFARKDYAPTGDGGDGHR
jgi:hypothetical protein